MTQDVTSANVQMGSPAVSLAAPALAQSQPSLAGRMLSLAVLLMALLICLPPLLVELGRRDTSHTMEQIALVSSQETWQRQHGTNWLGAEPGAWVIPTDNGRPRIHKPPLLVWLNLLAWADLAPENADVGLLTYRARLLAVVLGLVTIASTFWIGLTLNGRRLGLVAALVVGSCWFFQRQARTASYDIHMVAWATLAVAAGLWAMRPRQPDASWRHWSVGWALAGLALGLGWMTKGPLALVIAALPLVGAMALLPRRLRALAGLAVALVIATVISGPWYAYVAWHYPEIWQVWFKEYAAPRREFQPVYYYVGLLGLVLPWSLWLVAGLIQPFVRASAGRRRELLVAWVWFVLIIVFFSIPGAKQQRYILPILPAVGLLVAQVFREHALLSAPAPNDRAGRMLTHTHWALLLAVSFLALPLLAAPAMEVGPGWLVKALGQLRLRMAAMPWSQALVASLGLSLLAALGWWCHARWRPILAALVTAVWAVVLTTLLLRAYALGAGGVHPIRQPAQRVAAVIGGAELRYLYVPSERLPTPVRAEPNEEFRLYARRIVPALEASALPAEMAKRDRPLYLLARAEEVEDRVLRENGLRLALERVQTDRNLWHRLWRYDPPSASTKPSTQP